ncbi:MAG: hypothetical protein IJX88_04460 [Clostridia bacterium]|nr:hypothetical protein [Clostridia bacterium]
MRKFLKYELKKHLWALVVLSVVCAIPYMIVTSQIDTHYPTIYGYVDPSLSMIAVFLGLLCFLAPPFVFSFKMNKRGVDAYYALPLKRWKLYLVKGIMGLLLVFIPFTVAFLGGFLFVAGANAESHVFQLRMYVPAYFGFLLFGLCLYALNTFLFTRANTVADGFIFMLAYLPLGYFAAEWYNNFTALDVGYKAQESLLTVGGLSDFTNKMTRLICGNAVKWSAWTFVFPIVLGVAASVLLFVTLPFEKGENAEQISESWFGYKLFIPVYTAMFFTDGYLDIGLLCMIVVGAIVATVVFRRKFRFSWKWWVMIGGAIAIGLLLNTFSVHPFWKIVV